MRNTVSFGNLIRIYAAPLANKKVIRNCIIPRYKTGANLVDSFFLKNGKENGGRKENRCKYFTFLHPRNLAATRRSHPGDITCSTKSRAPFWQNCLINPGNCILRWRQNAADRAGRLTTQKLISHRPGNIAGVFFTAFPYLFLRPSSQPRRVFRRRNFW